MKIGAHYTLKNLGNQKRLGYLRQYCLLFCQLSRVLRKILVFRLKISIIPSTLCSATIAQLVRAPP